MTAASQKETRGGSILCKKRRRRILHKNRLDKAPRLVLSYHRKKNPRETGILTAQSDRKDHAMKKFEPTFESLYEYAAPAWFRDAKFGIWSHWGPQSVPMYGDWYARNMYIEGSDQYRYHTRHYGHPSQFGYKDICALWKAEKFDPEELMDLYVRAGARYFVAQATHHDHFFNYGSRINRMNSVNV